MGLAVPYTKFYSENTLCNLKPAFVYYVAVFRSKNPGPKALAVFLLNFNDLREVNLEGANLSGTDLSFINLAGANLSKSNLQGALLEGVNLIGSDLSYANLSDSNCASANFSSANPAILTLNTLQKELPQFQRMSRDITGGSLLLSEIAAKYILPARTSERYRLKKTPILNNL